LKSYKMQKKSIRFSEGVTSIMSLVLG
jgi:hypothetical protein